MFDVIRAPKVSRDEILKNYGEEFTKIFDDCDGCIGVAMDYQNNPENNENMTAKEYSQLKKKENVDLNCLTEEITREECK